MTAATWRRRRAELEAIVLTHEYGGLPPRGVRTEVICRARSRIRHMPGVLFRQFHGLEVRRDFQRPLFANLMDSFLSP